MALTNEEVLHLSKLCRVDLRPDEVEQFTSQLSSIIEYVGKLQEVDVDVTKEAVANITGLENILREDEVRTCPSEERDRIVKQFPARQGDLLKTRGVFSQ
jgi:aspartyl-tRNA(Asn)/glutamyl-tRNA(Gln) amidotransferase subunit C